MGDTCRDEHHKYETIGRECVEGCQTHLVARQNLSQFYLRGWQNRVKDQPLIPGDEEENNQENERIRDP